MTQRMGSAIPCGTPFNWVPDALDQFEASLRGDQNRSEIVRGMIWEGLNWVEAEAIKGRYPLRPRASLLLNKSNARVGAYSLTGEYVSIPDRLEKAVRMLNEHERERFEAECKDIVKHAKQAGGQRAISWTPDGKRPGVVLSFAVDKSDSKTLAKIADASLYDSEWTVTNLARELLARKLLKYAPKGWDTQRRVARGVLFFRSWQS